MGNIFSSCSPFIRCLWRATKAVAHMVMVSREKLLERAVWIFWQHLQTLTKLHVNQRHRAPLCACSLLCLCIYYDVTLWKQVDVCRPPCGYTCLGDTHKASHNVEVISVAWSFCHLFCVGKALLSCGLRCLTWFGFHTFTDLLLFTLAGGQTNELWWKFTSQHCRHGRLCSRWCYGLPAVHTSRALLCHDDEPLTMSILSQN